MAGHRDIVFDGFNLSGRKIADHKTAGQTLGERAEARDVSLQLVEPHRRWNVQRLERLLANHSIDIDAVPSLETPHRRVDIGVKNFLLAARRAEITGDRKPFA